MSKNLSIQHFINEFEPLKNNFYEFTKKMQQKLILDQSKLFLQENKLDKLVKPRIFLSAFLIYYLGNEIFDDSPSELLQITNSLINTVDNDIRKNVLQFSIQFNKWKKNDIEILKRDLFHEYQLIESELQTTTNPELIELLEMAKKNIIDSMDLLKIKREDFSNLEYFDSQEFLELLTTEMSLHKYNKFIEILSFFKNFFKLFLQDKEIDNKLDIPFIQQQLEHQILSINEINQLFIFMFQLMKKIHAPVHDETVNTYIQEIVQNNNNEKIPHYILNLLSCVRNLVNDLEKLKE